MDKEFIKAQIQELTAQVQMAFANWHRAQGALIAYQQVLARIEEGETEISHDEAVIEAEPSHP